MFVLLQKTVLAGFLFFGIVKGVYFNNNDFFQPGRYLLKQNEHVLVKVKIIGTLWDSRHLGGVFSHSWLCQHKCVETRTVELVSTKIAIFPESGDWTRIFV